MGEAEPLVDDVNANFVGSFRLLARHAEGGESRQFGGVFAFATGAPVALFNGCVAVSRSSAGDLEEAIAWVRRRGVPYHVWIDDERATGLVPVAERLGLERAARPYPGMVLGPPIPGAPEPRAGISVTRLDPGELDLYLQVLVDGGFPAETAQRLFPASLLRDPDVAFFVAELEGRPVGTSIAIRTGEAGGVYGVGTLEAARRRGVGEACTWAAVDAAREWGCTVCVLQATPMGRPLYERMGFRTVVPYAEFYRPAPTRDA